MKLSELQIIAANIRDRRRRLGITQAELAARTQMSATSLNRIEAGVQRPQRGNIVAIAQVLGCSEDELYLPIEKVPGAATQNDMVLKSLLEGERIRQDLERELQMHKDIREAIESELIQIKRAMLKKQPLPGKHEVLHPNPKIQKMIKWLEMMPPIELDDFYEAMQLSEERYLQYVKEHSAANRKKNKNG